MANNTQIFQALALSAQQGKPAAILPTINGSPIIPIGPQTAPPVPFPMEPAPEPPPPAPAQPIDQTIKQRLLELAGPAPTAPVARQPGKLDRIAAGLMGFSAGMQGRGPEYLAYLNEQRERPQREYQQRLDEYNARRSQLGLIGTQAAMEQAETRRRDIQTQAERQADREFQQWLQRSNIQDQRAIELARQAFELEKESRRAQAEERERQAKERAQQERDAVLIAADFGKLGAPADVAKELGRYWAGLKDSLSPAASKFESTRARLEEARARRLAMGGGGSPSGASAQKALADFEAIRQAVDAAVKRGDVRAERMHRRNLDRAFGALSRFPGQIETGYDQGGNPVARLRSAPAQGQPQAPAKTVTMAQIRATAQKAGISEAEAIQRAQAAGYTVTQQ